MGTASHTPLSVLPPTHHHHHVSFHHFTADSSNSIARGAEIPQEIMQKEQIAFEVCESDGEEGLTWEEVASCEEVYGPVLQQSGSSVPTQEDFLSADLNSDGILLFDEWVEWAELQA